MSATKILWAQIVVVFGVVLVTIWAATQWVAWKLGYQPQLGQPWFEFLPGVPIYLPPAFFWWWYAYDAYAPRVFVEGAYIAASGGFISIAAAIAMSVWRAREAKIAATYGSARWATRPEICAARLTGSDGVVLGWYERGYLRHDGPEHVLCFAPTRSGKGVGLVVPTLLTWPGSCIVHDIKGENWILTSGFRALRNAVISATSALASPSNHAWRAHSKCFFSLEALIYLWVRSWVSWLLYNLLASSGDRNWTHLLAERRSHGAGELPSLVPRDTEIAVLLRGHTLVERQGGGMRQRTFATRGTTWLCPSGIREEYVSISKEIVDCLHVFLPGRPFADTVLQDLDLDPSRVNLRYESIAHDSLIEPIAERILAELDAETSSVRSITC
jgi:hypothetical protein